MRKAQKVLILGGGGMVGLQVAREIARELNPGEIVISALTQGEVDEALGTLSGEAKSAGWSTRFSGVAGDIFLPVALQKKNRADLTRDRESYDILFDDIFSSHPDGYRKSSLYQLIDAHKPEIIVDCINTATAISYQDSFSISRKVKMLLDRAEEKKSVTAEELPELVQSVRELIISQGVPQIVRHIMFLQRALKETAVHVYVKVGTTGTGGMGINIPYTHSEDRPSATLLSKSAVGFAHTGLLFLLARTPDAGGDEDVDTRGAIIKEVKPGAMIGFKRLGLTHVKLAGPSGRREPAFLLSPKKEEIKGAVNPRHSFDDYPKFEGKDVPLKIVGADTGENGFFSIGEFHAITYPRQMEYVTPEECARTVVLEILGASTGRDVLSAIDGAITEPSYRAGVLRANACAEMDRLEKTLADQGALPSIAVGHLGPPRLSKLLIEAFLLRAAAGTSSLAELRKFDPEALRQKVETYLEQNPRITSLITTIGIPLLRVDKGGFNLMRGPRLNIPVPLPGGEPIAMSNESIEEYATRGWVDLRAENFATWVKRLGTACDAKADIVHGGSAAFDRTKYLPDEFVPGDFVGWYFTNEVDSMGMVGRRLY